VLGAPDAQLLDAVLIRPPGSLAQSVERQRGAGAVATESVASEIFVAGSRRRAAVGITPDQRRNATANADAV
jgi:hypothetical protein